MRPILTYKADKMDVSVFNNRAELGFAAAQHVGVRIKELLEEKEEVRIIFAAAASQREFLKELLNVKDIPWNRIVAFQMDEYHTLPKSAPQRFGNFLESTFYKFRDFKEIHFIDKNIKEYESLINSSPIDIVCMGIGENGHLAFNDPPVADFQDPKVIKEVYLDEVCRQQQVNDGEFTTFDSVPEKAVTLTIPILLDAKFISVVVPGATKAEAVLSTLFNEISEACPASILRTKSNATLFLDIKSSQLIMSKIQ